LRTAASCGASPGSRAGLKAIWPPGGAWPPIEIAGVVREWVTYPGVFARRSFDDGTQLLLSVLPPIGARAKVLDYGCGPVLSPQPSRPRADPRNSTSSTVTAVALVARGRTCPARLSLGTDWRPPDPVATTPSVQPPLHRGSPRITARSRV